MASFKAKTHSLFQLGDSTYTAIICSVVLFIINCMDYCTITSTHFHANFLRVNIGECKEYCSQCGADNIPMKSKLSSVTVAISTPPTIGKRLK